VTVSPTPAGSTGAAGAVIDAPPASRLPAAVRAEVRHERTPPFRYGFAHRTTQWFVDVDDVDRAGGLGLPRGLRLLGTLRGTDHFEPTDTRPWGVKVRADLARHGVDWSAHRVLALSGSRSFGHAFDPLTTYVCFDSDGTLEGVLAEVHNTYGQWHSYPLAVAPAAPGSVRTTTSKEFYVSPFFTVDGSYAIEVRLDPTSVAVRITLTQSDRVVFTGSVRGALRPATTRRRRLAHLLRDPASSLRVAALIRLHGVRLWLRRLPVVPRPPQSASKGSR